MTGLRVLVCGGRVFDDEAFAFHALDQLAAARGPFGLVIHGAARGADTLGAVWAERRRIATAAFPAEWERLGRAAGLTRNAQMLAEGKPDLVIAFPGGRGTAHMMRISRAAGIEVVQPVKPALCC